jgi:dCTP deaminase
MIVNRAELLGAKPIKDMIPYKEVSHGVSHGMTEAGYDLRVRQAVHLSPRHRFELASTIEEFDMPSDLVGVVHDKSTHARRAISVFNTVIEPGWRGFLTLEIAYFGDYDIIIPAGSGIAQVLFHRVEVPAFYEGKYQNQPDMPVSAKLQITAKGNDAA